MSEQNKTETSFKKPRHWSALEELSSEYWSNPKDQEVRGQEFAYKPIETLENLEKIDSKGFARREFLTVMGASMAMAGFACARRPVNKIIPYVVQPEEITVGVANWYASTSGLGSGILIKTREGRPIKLEGNPDDPDSQGALSTREQASVLDLYDPDRLQGPLKKGAPASWEEIDSEISAQLKAAAAQGGAVRVLSQPLASRSTRRLFSDFVSQFKNGKLVEYSWSDAHEIADGQKSAYGTSVIPRYHFDQADVVVSLGSDFLDSGAAALANSKAWVKKRKLGNGNSSQAKMSKFFAFESTPTVTGTNADQRVAVRGGDELLAALAIAHEIIVRRKKTRYAGDPSVVSALSPFSAASLKGRMDVEIVQEAAEDLLAAQGKGIVIAGALHSHTSHAGALHAVANLLNSALGNEGATVDGTASPYYNYCDHSDFDALLGEMRAGKVDVLLIHESNLAYGLPSSLGFADALSKVKTVVLASTSNNETAKLSHYVAANHHFLENWGDAERRKGLFTLQQPAIAPMYQTRAFQDSLLSWSKMAGLSLRGSWYDYLRGQWKSIHRSHGGGDSFQRFWEKTLEHGVLDVSQKRGSARSFRTGALNGVRGAGTAQMNETGLSLVLYEKSAIRDGSQANNAWLQEAPDPITTATWDNYLSVSPATAEKKGLRTHDVVKVTSGDHSVEVPVLVVPGMHASAVSLAVGYGRTAAGKVGTRVGVDASGFVTRHSSGLSYVSQNVFVEKTGRRYEVAITQGHHRTLGRPIVNDITLGEFQKDPKTENHTNPHLKFDPVPTLWPKHEYNGYKWGMAVDLNSCTGCGACVVACQAENNIPVVGRNQVRVGREMHWIRIDRYYSGDENNPDFLYQPMVCQHCDNAPCETVCPVLATTHSSEGLNDMTYNRCVGTRYCQNNCPYKVRRFNFFDHWKSYAEPMNQVWNPDVTVRTRGVMEKCTFCVQRIQAGKDHAKDENRLLKDGEVKTACQQTCPTDAITFGDMNNSETQVAQLQASDRAFRVLEVQNTKPAVSYLTKVRNKDKGKSHVKHDH